ncbi:hypothetical protein ACIRRA_45005 [Nocardia sp. NPDC101769]
MFLTVPPLCRNADRKGTHFLWFPTLAAALTCYKKLAKAKPPM